ncbi:MAG: hypothetical protein Harvfovirus20_20 [Harvfovirus sp.]|uniref:Uncharacterized protein n=1 Tax=Harvfovirus sp. TaxID=2487768 RepID=A0A3G5A4R0_9VIRU|nr:MAG: hypothetical protein Harvfovirus20_20 [Harvfovirus sp.]
MNAVIETYTYLRRVQIKCSSCVFTRQSILVTGFTGFKYRSPRADIHVFIFFFKYI